MKTLEEAIIEVFHQPSLGHGEDCYCEALQLCLAEHNDIVKIIKNDPIMIEAIVMSHLMPVSLILPALSITMIEVGIRIGLKMSTPDLESIL